MAYLRLKKSNCKNCYRCVRNCPVKAIRISGQQAHIVEEECILCGQCFVACPQNAKEIVSSLETVKVLLAQNPTVIASVAPSFAANYPGINITALKLALQKLGFADAEETAQGATAVKNAYDKLLEEHRLPVIISSCCHSVNLLIRKYYPEVLPYLAPVATPMYTHGKRLKEDYPDAKVVFIGPCISKKAEADEYGGVIDAVLTFEELSEWLVAENIALTPITDTEEAGKTRLFPIAGGILKTMQCAEKDYVYMSIDGTKNCITALEEIRDGKLTNCFIEMSACVNSCVGGPVMTEMQRRPIEDYSAITRYAGINDFSFVAPKESELVRLHAPITLKEEMPSEEEITAILKQMGKTKPEDELNCGTCGYETCRKKAVAVYQKKADISMCLPFLKEKAESFSDHIIRNTPNGIIVLNEMLEVQQINAAALKLCNLRTPSDVLGEPVVRILDPSPFLDVQQKHANIRSKLVYLAEYGRYVEESIIHDTSYQILIGILRDVTEQEEAKKRHREISQETVAITDHVIEKQMRAVQEIASLLGETTAETKIALTNLKESLNNE